MKKLIVFLVVITFIGAVMSGCSTTQGSSDDYFGYNPKPKVVEKQDNFHAYYNNESDSTDSTYYYNGGGPNGNPNMNNYNYNYYPDYYGYYSPWGYPSYGYGYPMLTFGYNNFYMGYGYSPFYNPYYIPYYRYNYWDYGYYPYYGYTNYNGNSNSSPRKDRNWGPSRGGYQSIDNNGQTGTWINKRTGGSNANTGGNSGHVFQNGNPNYGTSSGSNNTGSGYARPDVQTPKGNVINRTGNGNQSGNKRSSNVVSSNDTYRYDAIKQVDRSQNTFRANQTNTVTQSPQQNRRVVQNNSGSMNRSVPTINHTSYSAPARSSAPVHSGGGSSSSRSSSGGGSHSRGK
ncbi:MAG: hypothetical protein ABSG15_11635 [FCB group bacterium]|jgi:hypothetical protein